MSFVRFEENPLIVPEQVPPSVSGLDVMCSFNAGVTEFNGEVLLLMRVAERPVPEEKYVSTLVLDPETSEPKMVRFGLDDPKLDVRDPRVFYYDGNFYLTSLSHLRIARSKDGRAFTIDEKPALMPSEWYEEFGIEDAHITKIDETYWITAVGVSRLGVSTVLYSTKDFVDFERHGIIFPCDNRDVTLFPEKIGDDYFALHRPMSTLGKNPAIWTARSQDLIKWGDHNLLMESRPGIWDEHRVGASTVPIKTDQGWLEIYHGATANDDYCLGTVLLDLDDPNRVIARGEHPVLKPEAPYETEGLLSNVVFSCGCVVRENNVLIYYGAADKLIAGAQASLDDLMATL